jgi:hypothetical protein
MTSADTKKHPVWDVYDEFRTARLSHKYYCGKLARLERSNFWLECVLAGTASGSAIAALTFWRTNDGKIAWTGLTILSALLAVIKPLVKLTDRIQRIDAVAVGYSLLDHDYHKLQIAISQDGKYTNEHQVRFRALLERGTELKKQESVERTIDETLRRKCSRAVENELPTTKFLIPEA